MAWPDGLPVGGGSELFEKLTERDSKLKTDSTHSCYLYLVQSHRSWGTALSLAGRNCHSNLSLEPTNRDALQTEAWTTVVSQTHCKDHHHDHHYHYHYHHHHHHHHLSYTTHHFSIRLTQSPTTATHTSLTASACCTWNHTGNNRKKVLCRSVAVETNRK